jgi:hypothetical protein
MQIVSIDDPNSIAAYDTNAHQLVIVFKTDPVAGQVRVDLSGFTRTGKRYVRVMTSTAALSRDADRRLFADAAVNITPGTKTISMSTYPNTVETVVIEGVYR